MAIGDGEGDGDGDLKGFLDIDKGRHRRVEFIVRWMKAFSSYTQ